MGIGRGEDREGGESRWIGEGVEGIGEGGEGIG